MYFSHLSYRENRNDQPNDILLRKSFLPHLTFLFILEEILNKQTTIIISGSKKKKLGVGENEAR